MSVVLKCPLCSWFAAKTLKGVLRHMGTVHAFDSSFFVRCAADDCPRTYRNYHSYKKHLYKKHREMLDGPCSLTDDFLPTTSEEVVPDLSVSETEASECTLPSFSTNKIDRKKEAALFVLKSKHIHKVSQGSLSGLLDDFSSMLESRVHSLETQILEVLGDADLTIKQQISKLFQSQDVVDPFIGLKTEHMQKIYFKENLHLVVSIPST